MTFFPSRENLSAPAIQRRGSAHLSYCEAMDLFSNPIQQCPFVGRNALPPPWLLIQRPETAHLLLEHLRATTRGERHVPSTWRWGREQRCSWGKHSAACRCWGAASTGPSVHAKGATRHSPPLGWAFLRAQELWGPRGKEGRAAYRSELRARGRGKKDEGPPTRSLASSPSSPPAAQQPRSRPVAAPHGSAPRSRPTTERTNRAVQQRSSAGAAAPPALAAAGSPARHVGPSRCCPRAVWGRRGCPIAGALLGWSVIDKTLRSAC